MRRTNPRQGPIESDPTQRTSETPGANSYGLPLWQACNILDAREGCKLGAVALDPSRPSVVNYVGWCFLGSPEAWEPSRSHHWREARLTGLRAAGTSHPRGP